jgi:hypothetical protein
MRKRISLSIALVMIALPAMAQDSGISEVSWGSAILGAIGLAIASWLSGVASQAKPLGKALMDKWIRKIQNSDTE